MVIIKLDKMVLSVEKTARITNLHAVLNSKKLVEIKMLCAEMAKPSMHHPLFVQIVSTMAKNVVKTLLRLVKTKVLFAVPAITMTTIPYVVTSA
jgi:hypothetical protein